MWILKVFCNVLAKPNYNVVNVFNVYIQFNYDRVTKWNVFIDRFNVGNQQDKKSL